MQFRIKTLLALAGMLLSAQGHTQALRTANRESPPIAFSQDKQISGICPDLLQAISKQDPQLQFIGQDQMVSLGAIEQRLQSGFYDVICGLAKTPEREKYTYYLSRLFEIEHRVLVREDDKVNIDSLAELATLSASSPVIVRRGSSFASWLKQNNVQIDDSSDDNEGNLRKLSRGRGRFYYSAGSLLQMQRKQYGYENKTRLLPTVFYSQPVHLATSQGVSPELRQRLDAAVEALRHNGTLARILLQYQIGN